MPSKKMPPQVKADPVMRKIWRDIYEKDLNKLIFVCGGTGSCKSGSALTMCYELDRDENNKPRFIVSDSTKDPKNRVVTSAENFVRLVQTKLPKGSCIIWDEIGVGADNRDYFTLRNKLIKKVFQTFRYRNFIVFMTVPDFKSVDIGVRKLAHAYLGMKGQVPGGKMAYGIFQWVDVNPKDGEVYYKYPRWIDEKGDKKKLFTYYIPKPIPEIEDVYKRLKDRVNREWYEQYSKQLEYMQSFVGDKDGKSNSSLQDLEKEVMKDPSKYYNDTKEKFIDVLLEARLGLIHSKAVHLAKLLNAKVDLGEICV